MALIKGPKLLNAEFHSSYSLLLNSTGSDNTWPRHEQQVACLILSLPLPSLQHPLLGTMFPAITLSQMEN